MGDGRGRLRRSQMKLAPRDTNHCNVLGDNGGMATVFIPAPFRDLSGGADRVDVGGKTVRQVVNALDERYPGIKARLCGDDGALNPNVQVSVDGYVTRIGMLEKVGEASEVHFIPAIAGGQDALLRLDGKVALV